MLGQKKPNSVPAAPPPAPPRQASQSQAKQEKPRPKAGKANPNKSPGQFLRLPGDTAIDRWNQMPPEQREKALQQLPPARQQAVRERIQQFNRHFGNMAPQQQMRLRNMYEHFSKLPPDRQNLVRRELRQLQNIPDARRKVVGQELEVLRRMPDPDRRSRMNGEEFRNRYSPGEQQMLADLSESLPMHP